MSEPPPLSSAELKRAKRNVRRTTLTARDAIDAAVRSDRGSAITGAFMRLPEVEACRVVMVFWSFGSEVPTGPLIDALHARGIVVALPHIVAGEMQARRYEPDDPLTETAFGAMEPSAGVLIDPATIDVVATPAVAFDRWGARVGYGGGFYDRFFPRTGSECLRVGVAFGVQVLPPGVALPGGHFDLKVDLIVTESETIRCPRDR